MTALAKKPYLLLLLCMLLAGLIFVIDLHVPLGVADGIPYVAVVGLALWFREPRYTIYFAAACSVLTVAGYFGSPPGAEAWQAVTNRVLIVLGIWVTAILALQKRRTEKALHASEARAAAILATTADAVVTFDADGRLTSFNPAAERVFGVPAPEALGAPVYDLIAPSHRARFRNLLAAGEDAQPRFPQIEVVGLRRDGATFPVELAVSRMPVGERELFTMNAHDITERRRLEQEILSLSDRERKRIGYDLQENLGQMLTGIGLINRNLSARLQAEDQPFADDVVQVTELIREADQYARGLARGLVPVDLDAAGLAFALRRLAEEARRLWGVACTFEEDGEVLVHDNLAATHLYRIAQEAVHDAAVQRKATHVSVSLAAGRYRAQLCVEDDGCAPAAVPAGDDLGLAIMTYRAHLIDATLDVEAGPGGTTRLTCTLPHPVSSNGAASNGPATPTETSGRAPAVNTRSLAVAAVGRA